MKTTRVTAFDLDGRPLGPTTTLRGEKGTRTEIRAIAVDEDRRIWAADAGSGCVRAYNVSGAEVGRVESVGDPAADRPGALGDPAGLAVQGVESETRLLLSRRGHLHNALVLLAPDPAGDPGPPKVLHRDGDPREPWRHLAGVALAGDRALACEAGTGTIHVFRGGEFLFRIELPGSPARLEPRLVAPLADGRLVVACGGGTESALLLLDPGGGVLATIAAEGEEEGAVHLPTGLAVEEGPPRPNSRIAVLDRDAERIQVFTLDGRCYGSFLDAREIEIGQSETRRRDSIPGGRARFELPPESD